ncbi:MAG: hypothetical protein WDW38_001606 [Sanguina aurantia]
MSDSGSEDDVPLAKRAKAKSPAAKGKASDVKTNGSAPNSAKKVAAKPAQKPAPVPVAKPAVKAAVQKQANNSRRKVESSEEEDGEESDDARAKAPAGASNGAPKAKKAAAAAAAAAAAPKAKRKRKSGGGDGGGGSSGDDDSDGGGGGGGGGGEGAKNNIKLLYDGKPVELTIQQEEVAGFYAAMTGSPYLEKPTFVNNFWEGFKAVLGPKHVVKCLEKCDFSRIWDWQMAAREAKKNRSKEEKLAAKEEKEASEVQYKIALVDGRPEPVGNFRVEPPGLFRGRGEHPKMGKIKTRVFPRDVIINIGAGEPIPAHPYPDQAWKEVRHDQGVTWLAYFHDTVSPKDFKYVFLGANSTFKSDSDLAKYELARKLKLIIGEIRTNYERDWESPISRVRQMGVALYFIDKLALRAGHEKDDDEADTVGCCTLKVENVTLVPPHSIKFDFLGKDSIRYENTVEVHTKVYKNIGKFRAKDKNGRSKGDADMLFDEFDAGDLNKLLKSIMEGLSVKVFRTYNASIVLDRLLTELDATLDPNMTVDSKKAEYDKANKEVAILCNHQRAVAKTHDTQVAKIQSKLEEMEAELAELKKEKLEMKEPAGKEKVNVKIEKKLAGMAKMQTLATAKESLKTVALGTSKINYMDPRITIAWCKRNEVPLERIFNKSLLSKFYWAMSVEPEFQW